MSDSGNYFGSDTRYLVFKTVKYMVYVLLCVNIFLFLQEELLALEHTFVDGFDPGQLIQVFSATIDTAAWVILLLLFELETSVLDDSRIQGPVKWALHGIRGLCYIAVFYAFTGYYAELLALYDVQAMPGLDVCSLAGLDYSLLLDLDEYAALDAINCLTLGEQAYQMVGFNILADGDVLESAQKLAWVDVINSAAWLLVVIVLEVEVRLQLRGDLSSGVMNITKFFKLAVYATLFAAAFYWGYYGDFLDFWDACLWLFAFIFIELNVFEWQHETSQVDNCPDADAQVGDV